VYRRSTESVPKRQRVSFLQDFIASHIGGRRYSVADQDKFRVDSETMRLCRGLSMARVTSSPMGGVRTRDLLQDGRDDYVLLIHSEEYEMSVDGKPPVRIGKGDAMLLNEGNCSAFHYRKSNAADLLWLNRKMLADRVRHIDLQASYLIPRAAPVLPLLTAYARMLRDHPPVSAKAGDAVSGHVYDLVALALDNFVRGGADCDETSKAAARLRLVQRDILDNLSDPGLHIEDVARRHGITPRYIQLLFKNEGTTFTDFVRDSRLDRAYRRLKEHRTNPVTVSGVAYEYGFSDISTFSRAFRQRFKTTPSEARQEALQL
jgi:AraC-like DNA-binding protein